MTYDFECDNCKRRCTICVPYTERNRQKCGCGGDLHNVTSPTANIVIPASFAITGDPCAPQNADERARWDNDGVTLAKGGRWV